MAATRSGLEQVGQRMARAWRKKATNLVLAVLTPIVAQALFLIAYKSFRMMWLDELSLFIISPLLGFTFIVKEYRWWALIVGLAYIPAMVWLLFGFSLVFVGVVYDDWL